MINPIWYEKTKDGELMTDIFARLVKDRTLFLVGEITQESATTLCAMIMMLDQQSSEKKIELMINSDGGDASALFAIYDVMQMVKAPIRTICFGTASSAAAIILASGEPGERFCTPNAHVMIHQIQVDGLWGTGSEIENEVKMLKKLKSRINQVLARHTGHYEKKIEKDCMSDYHMDAEEAREYGIIDGILSSSKALPELKKKTRKKQ